MILLSQLEVLGELDEEREKLNDPFGIFDGTEESNQNDGQQSVEGAEGVEGDEFDKELSEELRLESQAARIIRKFGGARRLAALLKSINHPIQPAAIYKWTYPKSRGGTGGIIPTRAQGAVIQAARADGIIITSEDMDPRALPIKTKFYYNARQRYEMELPTKRRDDFRDVFKKRKTK